MAYCVRCGVELMDGAKACPLCHTPVLLPPEPGDARSSAGDDRFSEGDVRSATGRARFGEGDNAFDLHAASSDTGIGHALYPDRQSPVFRRRTNLVPTWPVVLLATFVLLIPFLVTLFVDLRANGHVTWSFYPMTSLALMWLMVAYPALLRRHTLSTAFTVDMLATAFFLLSLDLYPDHVLGWSLFPAPALVMVWICVMLPTWLSRSPVWMAALYLASVAGFLRLMEAVTGSGNWFLPLALPIAGAATLCGLGIWASFRFLKGRLVAASASVLLATLLLVAIDALVIRFVTGQPDLIWSPVTTAIGVPSSALLLATHHSAELRTFLHKKFHM